MRRYLPERPLPPYAYLWGRHPHPLRDPRGHSFGKVAPDPPPLIPMRWRDSPDYVYGIDLFNQGFYWEAHEVWEGLWKASGKAGTTAEFLKGLIKLAAAAIKTREGRSTGADHLAEGAIGHLRGVAASIGGQSFAGLNLATAIAMAEAIRASIREGAPPSTPPFPGFLVLRNE